MKLKQLQKGQVYVVVREAKLWEEYPLPMALLAKSLILSIFRSENTSEYALAYYSSSQTLSLVHLPSIHIFEWEKRTKTESGLTPAYDL